MYQQNQQPQQYVYPGLNSFAQPTINYPAQVQVDYYPPIYSYPYQMQPVQGVLEPQQVYQYPQLWPQQAQYQYMPQYVHQAQLIQQPNFLPTKQYNNNNQLFQMGNNNNNNNNTLNSLSSLNQITNMGPQELPLQQTLISSAKVPSPNPERFAIQILDSQQLQQVKPKASQLLKKPAVKRSQGGEKSRPMTRKLRKEQRETDQEDSNDPHPQGVNNNNQVIQQNPEGTHIGKRKRIHARNTLKNISNQIISYIGSQEIKNFFMSQLLREQEEKNSNNNNNVNESQSYREKMFKQFLEYVNKFKRRVFTIQDFYDKFWTNLDEQRGSSLHAFFSQMIRRISWNYLQSKAVARILTSKQMKDVKYHMKMRRYLFRRLELMGSVIDVSPDLSDVSQGLY